MDCTLPGSSIHGIFPEKNARVGWHALLQGIFPIQGEGSYVSDAFILYN